MDFLPRMTKAQNSLLALHDCRGLVQNDSNTTSQGRMQQLLCIMLNLVQEVQQMTIRAC